MHRVARSGLRGHDDGRDRALPQSAAEFGGVLWREGNGTRGSRLQGQGAATVAGACRAARTMEAPVTQRCHRAASDIRSGDFGQDRAAPCRNQVVALLTDPAATPHASRNITVTSDTRVRTRRDGSRRTWPRKRMFHGSSPSPARLGSTLSNSGSPMSTATSSPKRVLLDVEPDTYADAAHPSIPKSGQAVNPRCFDESRGVTPDSMVSFALAEETSFAQNPADSCRMAL